MQFLIEAITLSLLGGLTVTDLKAIVSTGCILLAFGVSSAIGIFFDFLSDPRVALRVRSGKAQWPESRCWRELLIGCLHPVRF